jgi:hypothetical protein
VSYAGAWPAADALVFCYPSGNAVARVVLGAENLTFRLRMRFRVFADPAAWMLGVLCYAHLRPAVIQRGRAWRVAGGER